MIFSPVSGFLPSLASLSDTSNVPKPTNCTFSPLTNSAAITSVKAFSAFSASFLESSACSATAAINSVLFYFLLKFISKPADKACPKDLCIALLHLYMFLHSLSRSFARFYRVFQRFSLPVHTSSRTCTGTAFCQCFPAFFFISRSCFLIASQRSFSSSTSGISPPKILG